MAKPLPEAVTAATVPQIELVGGPACGTSVPKAGMFIEIEHSSRVYVYKVDSDATAIYVEMKGK